MVHIEEITVQFGNRKVLNNISIQFHAGEMIGLVAPNGTGKSTLMNVLMNYLTPTEGQVTFRNQLTYSSKANEVKIHQLISMMPDQSDLYNHLTGYDHLKMFAMMWGSNKNLIDQTIEQLNMGHYVHRKTGTYSLGMRQRLCFAMQIVADTEIMMMDEVMNGLDPNNVEIISKLLLEKKKEGKLIIIASHLLDNLENYADRIFLFNEGKLVEINEIIEEFRSAKIKTIRIKQLDAEVQNKLLLHYPALTVQTLMNGMSLVHINELASKQLGDITQLLIDHHVADFNFGKVTLNDLYVMYYHEIV